ncbi:MAG: gliding motility-associated C-terminal domain-containing protein [Saprospiraceae bacterium]|nr:gliding motility-associated C-terminal domain-containing protein [Saprospiraceae bacterium]
MKVVLFAGWMFGAALLGAQTNIGLIAYYTFENNAADVTGNTANGGLVTGTPVYACGVKTNAIQLRGGDDAVRLTGPVKNEFDTEDFSVSLYFKSTGSGGAQYLVSKRRSDCSNNNVFYIRYVPATRTVNVLLSEAPNKSASWIYRLPVGTCWHHVAVTRLGGQVRFYLDGERQQQTLTASRIDLTNDGDLLVGTSDCLAAGEAPFIGLVDELRVYNRALDDREMRDLYLGPDRILSRDTLIYLGESVDVLLVGTCATQFSWMPTDGVAVPAAGETTITPTQAGNFIYRLNMADNASSCIATDSIRITVIDPAELDCNTVFLPGAFTPNNDGLNDEFGISNPFAVQDLISFEIFDRWGGRVFYSEDPFAKWDGSFGGAPVNPGVMLYRVRFRCNGVEQSKTGSVTILR